MRASVAIAALDSDGALQRRGTTQTGVRLYNERLVLSLIRAHGSLPKAEIARLTGLSPQTVSVIVRQLEADDLVQKGESLKGKVGQPSQPFSLNPDGAFSIGLKVGRRSGDLMLLGLDGQVRKVVHHPYRFPAPDEFLGFAKAGLDQLTGTLGPDLHKRISGLGVAAPFDIWKWEAEAGASHEVMEAWKDFDLTRELQALSPWPVHPCNDATAACAAEQFFGHGQSARHFAYIYVGYFIGGGVVLNGQLMQGPHGNAGAIGSIPVTSPDGTSVQLIRAASFYLLEQAVRRAGLDPSVMWYAGEDWSALEAAVADWIGHAAKGIAQASASLAAILDCPLVVIDGAMPASVRDRLAEAVRREAGLVNLDGISPFEIAAGSIGFNARALGAASLPLFANFMIDRDLLFKDRG